MKSLITRIFALLFTLFFFTSIIIGISWLFDCKPNNLYLVWDKLGSLTTVFLLLQLLFGEKITFK